MRPLGKLRVIGGRWRSRVVEFEASDDQGLRATPDRVRQTLFDWLAPLIAGSVCLDLFAGSGALGIEALSRGAGPVTFVDAGAKQVEQIRMALQKLGAEPSEIRRMDGVTFLRQATQNWDVVFLDPPFASTLLPQVLELLTPRLKANNRIFIEWPAGTTPALPPGWQWLREKQAGGVSFGLATYTADQGNPA